MWRRDVRVAGPTDVFLPIGSEGARIGSAKVLLKGSMSTSAEVEFGWNFWPQSCANQPAGVVFGIVKLLAPQVTLHRKDAVAGGLAGRPVFLRLTVRVGSKTTDSWFLPPTVLSPCKARLWAEHSRRFRLWRFGARPLVHVNVGWVGAGEDGEAAGDPEESTRAQASFFRLPKAGTAEQLSLRLVPVNGPPHDPGVAGENPGRGLR